MESQLDYHTAKALLEWQVEFGVTETISDVPVNRFEVAPEPKAKPVLVAAAQARAAPVRPMHPAPVEVDGTALARAASAGAHDIAALKVAMAGFEACELKRGARNLVFADGTPGARVMVIGEAPGREEDRDGLPFVGAAGQLLDKMLGAIDLSRTENAYLTNVLPWRPPQNREATPEEIAMLLPFLERHVTLAKPDFLVLMGNVACQAVLGKRGITRLRGEWDEAMGLPVLPMFHPAYLLRNPEKKREAWADLLSLKARLRD
ncbi:uracil-DNA glycosylase [Planktotalea arctica]|uniref:uracil-DNA glycosylase n=1 Tax=Planktotalea arctica TaxID=1481893 RepID=UPI00321BAD4D